MICLALLTGLADSDFSTLGEAPGASWTPKAFPPHHCPDMSCETRWRTWHPEAHMDRLCADCQAPGGARGLCTLCNQHLCCRCASLHQHASRTAPLPASDMAAHPSPIDTSCWPNRPPPCHLHGPEPLELFCETCDLLACSRCHLSSHVDHRLVHVGKALRDQLWLFERLTAQLEDKRSAVENSAKLIESRIHGLKILQRKAENQIKMAKMIIMNELNKRVNLLTEQLKKMSGDFRQQLEGQLQGLVELCSQLGQTQNFLSWATSHHQRGQLLFNKELIMFQMQQLLESQLQCDMETPVKIKFNWDASLWTKQISTLGHLTAEGGFLPHSERLSCSGLLKPHPLTCPALPASMCPGAVEQGCGFQTCFQSQACCPGCVASKACEPHPGLLVDLSLGSSGQKGSCQPLRPYPDRQLEQPSAKQPDEKGPERCHAGCKQRRQKPAAQRCTPLPGPLEPKGPRALVPHAKKLPQQRARQTLSPTEDAQVHCPSGKPPEAQQSMAVCSSLQLLLQSPHQSCRGQQPGRAQGWVDLDKLQLAMRRNGTGPGGPQPAVKQRTAEPARVGPDGLGANELQEPQRQLQALTPSAVLERGVAHQAEGQPSEVLQLLESNTCSSGESGLSVMSTPAQGGPTTEQTRPLGPPARAAPEGQPPRAARSLATAGGEQGNAAGQGQRRSAAVGPNQITPSTLNAHGRIVFLCLSSPTSYKTESGNIYACKETETEGRLGPRSQDSIREASALPKRPRATRVRSERSKARATPGVKSRRGPRADPMPAGDAVAPELLECSAAKELKGGHRDGMMSTGQLRVDLSEQLTANSTPQLTQCEKRGAEEEPSPALPETQTDPKSSPRPESETEACSETELEIESEPELESEPDLEIETDQGALQNPGSDQSLESETQPDSEANMDTEPDLVSAQQLETEANLESGIQAGSQPSLESKTDLVSELLPGSHSNVESEPPLESVISGLQAETCLASEPFLESGQQAESQSCPESEPELEAGLQTESQSCLESDSGMEVDPELPPTGELGDHITAENGLAPGHVEMENEDFCGVCLNGGDLLCCDRCPKVFHLLCHVPPLLSFPTGDWVCTLCRDLEQPEVEYDCENVRFYTRNEGKALQRGLSEFDLRKCEKLTLSISCNILSAPFQEPVSPLARHYYQIIKKPMDLSVVRAKLTRKSRQHYHTPEEFVADVLLMFRNCAKFNYPDSEVAQAGRNLEEFFSSKLNEIYPDRTFPALEDDSDSDSYEEAHGVGVAGFPWPNGKEHCHRKRKRSHSLNWRRHHF
ncbi:tripartite motif-containing protein 66-like isoform X2 [Brienomyrus brachyistius]|uniref:tripartite motif-containing protein 66-like isoform X2 n=1 Tax=Brienomyrus brachyistius TaxID=42636 RepID=UPI0020B3EC85|nr:tripartite motif-containing protein 66-like isoform X2 [Brienomyrus brachyistius]